MVIPDGCSSVPPDQLFFFFSAPMSFLRLQPDHDQDLLVHSRASYAQACLCRPFEVCGEDSRCEGVVRTEGGYVPYVYPTVIGTLANFFDLSKTKMVQISIPEFFVAFVLFCGRIVLCYDYLSVLC
jgi:hypothetical protein